MKKIAIAIDFSKKTFDATILRREEDRFLEVGYSNFTNDKTGFKSFEKWVKSCLKGLPEAKQKGEWLFCGEHTGPCSLPLCDFLATKGYFMWLESALVIHRKCGIIREKSDKVDSRRIADYALRNFSTDIKEYQPDSRELKKLKALFTAHTMLTKDKVAKINQLKSGTLDASSFARRHMEAQLAVIEKSLKEIKAELEALLTQSEEFAHNYSLLDSFKGVGILTIACLIIKTRNFKDMTDPREFGCFAGVVPHRCQSGTSLDKTPKTSRYRDREVNALLTTCVIIGIRVGNPIIKPYYERLIARGVVSPKAKNNCKFKVINILFAMIRNNKRFSMDIHGKSKKEWEVAI